MFRPKGLKLIQFLSELVQFIIKLLNVRGEKKRNVPREHKTAPSTLRQWFDPRRVPVALLLL